MNNLKLEDFIRENRSEFDHLEPSDKVWKHISGNPARARFLRVNPLLIRVAATVTIIIVASVIAIKTNYSGFKHRSSRNDPQLIELLEAESFYARQVNGKMDEIKKCYVLYPEIKIEVESDLNELDALYNNLRKDLRENVSNRTVIEAMIENSRNRLKLVDDVLEQIEC
jgi:hypothetical protein